MHKPKADGKPVTPVSCMSLFDGGVAEYIDACMAVSKARAKVFFHIPKTGGSSIRLALQKELPNFLNINKYSELVQWDDIIARHKEQPYDMLSGHLRAAELRALYNSGAAIAAITFIRDPAQRILSQYRFMISPKYPGHADFKGKFPTLEHFVKDGIQENPMLRTLVGECGSLRQAVQSVSQNFMFVGLTEYSTVHSFLVQRCFGLPVFHIPGRANRTVNTADNKIEMDDNLLGLLQEKCPLDIAFYKFMKKKHLSVVDDTFAAFYGAIAGPAGEIPFWQDQAAIAEDQADDRAG